MTRTTPPRPADITAVFPQLALLASTATRLHPRPGSPPAGSDLLQVLWCPFDHPPEDYMPRTAVFWRSAAAVTDVLNTPPEPPAVQYDHYVLEPCLIDPEQVTEYPAPLELDEELREQLEEWGARHKEPGGDYDGGEQPYYQYELSVAPGWKVGGWAPWSFRDPSPQHCPACGTPMLPLLTIATGEWDASNHSWIPYENQAALSSTSHGYPRPSNPTAVQIGRGYNQQLYICPVAPEHPHTEWMQ